MRKNLFFLAFSLIILSFTGCSEQEIEIPANVIPKEKMIAILIDVQYIEGAKTKHIIGFNQNQDVYQYYASVFEKHHISQTQFEESISFYESNPKLLKEMYEIIIERLNEKKANLKKIK